jgi:hypothetical protein
MLQRLTNAFREKDQARILKLSAEIGHYVADAHVPLHASTNHNGQLTGQEGIHAFWESRIPELLAEKEWTSSSAAQCISLIHRILPGKIPGKWSRCRHRS